MNGLEAWIRLYEDEMAFARQHESLRTSSTHLIAGATGAVLALLASEAISLDKQSVPSIAVAAFVIVINGVGFFLGVKHYQRARRHQAIARAYRKVISDNCQAGDKVLSCVRSGAIAEHKCRSKSGERKMRVHCLWGIIHIIFVVLGLLLLLFLAFRWWS